MYFRFLNEKELEPSDSIVMEQKKDGTCILTLKDASADLQGEVKAVASNVGGEDLMKANLEVRGQAPTFVEQPMKCTILEGEFLACSAKCEIDNLYLFPK